MKTKRFKNWLAGLLCVALLISPIIPAINVDAAYLYQWTDGGSYSSDLSTLKGPNGTALKMSGPSASTTWAYDSSKNAIKATTTAASNGAKLTYTLPRGLYDKVEIRFDVSASRLREYTEKPLFGSQTTYTQEESIGGACIYELLSVYGETESGTVTKLATNFLGSGVYLGHRDNSNYGTFTCSCAEGSANTANRPKVLDALQKDTFYTVKTVIDLENGTYTSYGKSASASDSAFVQVSHGDHSVSRNLIASGKTVTYFDINVGYDRLETQESGTFSKTTIVDKENHIFIKNVSVTQLEPEIPEASISVKDGAKGVNVGSAFTIKFQSEVDASTLSNIKLLDAKNNAVAVDAYTIAGNCEYVLVPKNPLNEKSLYKITIPKDTIAFVDSTLPKAQEQTVSFYTGKNNGKKYIQETFAGYENTISEYDLQEKLKSKFTGYTLNNKKTPTNITFGSHYNLSGTSFAGNGHVVESPEHQKAYEEKSILTENNGLGVTNGRVWLKQDETGTKSENLKDSTLYPAHGLYLRFPAMTDILRVSYDIDVPATFNHGTNNTGAHLIYGVKNDSSQTIVQGGIDASGSYGLASSKGEYTATWWRDLTKLTGSNYLAAGTYRAEYEIDLKSGDMVINVYDEYGAILTNNMGNIGTTVSSVVELGFVASRVNKLWNIEGGDETEAGDRYEIYYDNIVVEELARPGVEFAGDAASFDISQDPKITFNTPLEAFEGEITLKQGENQISISSGTLSADGFDYEIDLGTTELIPNTTYTIIVPEQTDISNKTVAEKTITFKTMPKPADLRVDSYSFEDKDGNSLSEFTSNQLVNANVTLINTGDVTAPDAVAVLALYDANNKLKAVVAEKISITAGGMSELKATFKTPSLLGEGAYVKMFVANSVLSINTVQGAARFPTE